jgi:hypothetical protein
MPAVLLAATISIEYPGVPRKSLMLITWLITRVSSFPRRLVQDIVVVLPINSFFFMRL